jgi:hypothetical protein
LHVKVIFVCVTLTIFTKIALHVKTNGPVVRTLAAAAPGGDKQQEMNLRPNEESRVSKNRFAQCAAPRRLLGRIGVFVFAALHIECQQLAQSRFRPRTRSCCFALMGILILLHFSMQENVRETKQRLIPVGSFFLAVRRFLLVWQRL